jgi:hypothetical protein
MQRGKCNTACFVCLVILHTFIIYMHLLAICTSPCIFLILLSISLLLLSPDRSCTTINTYLCSTSESSPQSSEGQTDFFSLSMLWSVPGHVKVFLLQAYCPICLQRVKVWDSSKRGTSAVDVDLWRGHVDAANRALSPHRVHAQTPTQSLACVIDGLTMLCKP